MYSPYNYHSIESLLKNESLSLSSLSHELAFLYDAFEILTQLFQSQEWKYLSRVFSITTLSEILMDLLNGEKLKTFFHLMKNWPNLFVLFCGSIKNKSIITNEANCWKKIFKLLNIKQIDALGHFVQSLPQNKLQFDKGVEGAIHFCEMSTVTTYNMWSDENIFINYLQKINT